MRIRFLVAGLLWSAVALSQSATVKLPVIIPPSPEVSQLTLSGAVSTGLHNGAANVSLPLYTLPLNHYALKIGLDYSSSGMKVDDIPSRVGMGWNLTAGGMISRVIHDEPDGDKPFVKPPSNLSVKDQNLLTYLNYAVTAGIDTEWDEYSYSFNGQSGKFFLDSAGNGTCIPFNNLRIKASGVNTAFKSFEITAADGTRYEFGITAREKTRSFNVQGGAGTVSKQDAYETAWFLDRITTIDNELVSFNYSPLFITTQQGVYQTMIKPYNGAMACAVQPCSYVEQSGMNILTYDTYYLSNISAQGVSIDFSYELRPDSSHDNRLKFLTIRESGSPSVKKLFRFEYLTPTNYNNSLNRRFFLSGVHELEIGTGDGSSLSSGNWISHGFEYFDLESLPARLSYSQDWAGYNNGVNNFYFAPYVPSIASSVVNGSIGANRDPSSISDIQKGMIRKINYPTGGYREFVYEQHAKLKYTSTPVYSAVSVNGGGSAVYDPVVFYSSLFVPNSDQQATLHLQSNQSPAYSNSPLSVGEGSKIYELRLRNMGTNTVVLYRKYFFYTVEDLTVALQGGQTYKIELTVWGERNAGLATLQYNPININSYENKKVAGLRVKQIKSFDPVTGQFNNSFYTYAAASDLTKSSAVGPNFSTDSYMIYRVGTICYDEGVAPHIGVCNNYFISSGSVSPSYSFGGSPYGYTHVIESNDSSYANGFTEHVFHTQVPTFLSQVWLGNYPLTVSNSLGTELNGYEYRTRYYRKNSNGFTLLKQLEQVYEFGDTGIHKSSFYISQRWDDPLHYNPPSALQLDGFDLIEYKMESLWPRLKYSIATDYDANGQHPVAATTNYTYSSLLHLMPTRIEKTTEEPGVTDILLSTYASDLTSSGTQVVNFYDTLKQRNILTLPVLQSQYRGLQQVSASRTNYRFSFGIPVVSSMEWGFNGAPLEKRLEFPAYDSLGHTLEQRKTSDLGFVYLWGYRPARPIAEVTGASYDETAFTSFEAEANGNWIIASTIRNNGQAFTGKQSYSLSSGTVQHALAPSKTYRLSYWTTSANPLTVAGTQGSARLLAAAGNWTCFEHTLGGVSTVQLSGTALIDELRLCPQQAFMKTYTYNNLVGVSSFNNESQQVSFFSYDGLGRLILVRDRDMRILKKFEYKYGEPILTCNGNSPNWQPTGQLRCMKDGNNNNTGYQQQELKDQNPCSVSYLQSQWTTSGLNVNGCPVVANCTGVDKRVVNGVCETGLMVFTGSVVVNGVLYCVYHYEWSDGYWSPNYQLQGWQCSEV